ncbi:TPA: hypothetical protein ACX6RO_001785 [Photobacterium damselae]
MTKTTFAKNNKDTPVNEPLPKEPNKRHGNCNNKNAVKSQKIKLDDKITIRVNAQHKQELSKMANADGFKSLSKWLLHKASQ